MANEPKDEQKHESDSQEAPPILQILAPITPTLSSFEQIVGRTRPFHPISRRNRPYNGVDYALSNFIFSEAAILYSDSASPWDQIGRPESATPWALSSEEEGLNVFSGQTQNLPRPRYVESIWSSLSVPADYVGLGVPVDIGPTAGVQENTEPRKELSYAFRDGNVDRVRAILETLENPYDMISTKEREGTEYTILHWACFGGNTEIVKMFLEIAEQLNKVQEFIRIRNYYGRTALDVARTMKGLKNTQGVIELLESYNN